MVRKSFENVKFYFYCRFKLAEEPSECGKIYSEITNIFKEQKVPRFKTLKIWSSAYLKEKNSKSREKFFKFDENQALAFKRSGYQLTKSTPFHLKRAQFYAICRYQLDISYELIFQELQQIFGQEAPTLSALKLWILSCRTESLSITREASVVIRRIDTQTIKEMDNLKQLNESLQQQLINCKANLEKYAKENELLVTENQRLQIIQSNSKKNETENNADDFESNELIDKARKEQMDMEILDEFIKRCKDYKNEINNLKEENTSLRTRFNQKFESLREKESICEKLKEQIESQNLKLKDLAIKFGTDQEKPVDYLKEIEMACESSRLRSRNMRRDLITQKSDFGLTINRYKRRELYYVDEIKRLKEINERLAVEIEEKNYTISLSSLSKQQNISESCKRVKSPDIEILIVDDLNDEKTNESLRYTI